MTNKPSLAPIEHIRQVLDRAGYTLGAHQPHTMGERFLMRNLTTQSGSKVILLGTDRNHTPAVIKVASGSDGVAELEHERACRQLLQTISFAYESFHAPEEIAYWNDGPFTVSIQQFITQESAFIDRPLEEQFRYALQAFKIQESARATTASHYQTIVKKYGIRTSADYINLAEGFIQQLQTLDPDEEIVATCQKTLQRLQSNQERIEQYCGFLTHTDFVPHNFRIHNDTMYLLDTASLEFGNKHESWARFLNFMTLYNYKLENALIAYVERNRAPEERESLQLMRLYRLIEIITYYAKTIPNCNGDLHRLNTARVEFWHNVLLAELQDQRIRRDLVEEYRITRDRLRSQDEKVRQQGLH